MEFVKNFVDWFGLKPVLHRNKKGKQFSQREIWWCHLGSNIGFEIDGKTSEYTRPVLIIKKISHETALILPLRTKTKNGSWYVPLVVDKKQAVVILSQSKTIDRKRLKTRIETINEADFNEIKQKFIDFIT
jgi:mRNA-degrading endonuclease toxin of MazEF toxin-antitoxin module